MAPVRTEQLLRETLADLAGQARTPEVTPARVLAQVPDGRRSRRRGLVLVLVLAAIVLFALAVAVPTILVNRVGEPVGRVRGNWNLNHRVELPPGWEIRGQTVSVDSELTNVGPLAGSGEPEESRGCMINVLAAGRGDQTGRRDGRIRATVDGRPAFYADSSLLDSPEGVSWEYAPGAFAIVSCGSDHRAASIALAERVRFETVEVRLPFRFCSLPDDHQGFAVIPPQTSAGGPSPRSALLSATEEGREPSGFEV